MVDLVQWIGVPLTIGPPGDPAVWTHTASSLISILLILAVATFYSTTGGLRSVVATDVVQLAVVCSWARRRSRNDGPRRLCRALAATSSCALSVFCLLVGIGSWLADSPAPNWFPFDAPWRGGLVLAGVALVPLWYHLGYRSSGALS